LLRGNIAVYATVIPNLRFLEESEPRQMNHTRFAQLPIRTKENRCAENPLESANQPSILLAAFLHTERVEHFRSAPESNRLALLPDGESCQKYRYDSVLPKRQPILRMACYLEQEPSIPTLKEQLTAWWPTDGQAAKNEWSRAKSQVLIAGLSSKSHEFDTVELVKDLL
jgi:hypothetical protein